MLLAIDIGNTDTTLGVFEDVKLRATWHMATNIHRMADEYAAILLNLLRHQNLDTPDITAVAMCSVVPPLITTYEDLFQRYFHLSPLVVGAGVKTGVLTAPSSLPTWGRQLPSTLCPGKAATREE